MASLAGLISNHTSQILQTWADEAKKTASARGLSKPELMNIMPVYLGSLARLGGEFATGDQLELIENHLSSRLRAGFNLDEILEEFALLGRAIVQAWSTVAPGEQPDPGELDRLLVELHAANQVVTRVFHQHLLEDEQTEKRYLRLLNEAFRKLSDGELPLSPSHLSEVLKVVQEATASDTAALLLHDSKTHELVLSASVGLAQESIDQALRSKDADSFVGTVAQSERPTAVSDAETTEFEVSETLRHSGIHALLGVRLPPHQLFLGVLYIGLRERRAFSGREMRRLEAIGQQLSLLLENARLHADLREQIEALHAERALREQFVSVIAHDLRGPLASATMAARLLASPRTEAGAPAAAPSAQDPLSLDKKAEIILRNLSRAERMTTDLLDVHRIHAGKRLELQLEEADLGVLAREVVDELRAQHGDRFVLQAQEGVRGVWGVSVLWRALWNLLSNAIKYGSSSALITVSVEGHEGGVQVSVHNEGTPISRERQATLFEPFTRATVDRAVKGWGLGLTLVRGCAEAHGGSVEVDSAEGRGTTFTLRLPRDARSAQQQA